MICHGSGLSLSISFLLAPSVSLIPPFSFLLHDPIISVPFYFTLFNCSASWHQEVPLDLLVFEGFRFCLSWYFLIHYPRKPLSSCDQETCTHQKIPAHFQAWSWIMHCLWSIPPNAAMSFPTSYPYQVKVEATLSFWFKFLCRWQVQCH